MGTEREHHRILAAPLPEDPRRHGRRHFYVAPAPSDPQVGRCVLCDQPEHDRDHHYNPPIA